MVRTSIDWALGLAAVLLLACTPALARQTVELQTQPPADSVWTAVPPSGADSLARVGLLAIDGGFETISWPASPLPAWQDSDVAPTAVALERELSYWRLGAVAGVALAGAAGTFEYQRRAYWEGRPVRFRIQNDWEYVRWTDKFGHFYMAGTLADLYRTSFEWAGMRQQEARYWGAGVALVNMMYYETLDGFGPQWGFSPGDALFNTLGAAYTFARWHLPALEPYQLKLSYVPSGWEGRNVTDDYEGHTWWVTANLRGVLPEAVGGYVPSWLGVSAGYGARVRDELDFLTESHYYIAPDIDISLLPFEGRLWDTLLPLLQRFRVPAPAVRISPSPRLFLVFY
jgi:hypothetical protein